MNSIATDISNFEDFRQRKALYVDKTDYVWKMISAASKIYFLSRPRRFGKSLLLSTFDAFFKGKKELFKGLKIEKLAAEWKWEEYPVINITMSSLSSHHSAETLQAGINEMLNKTAKKFGYVLTSSAFDAKFDELILKLQEQRGKKAVILIDEYDKPILDNILSDEIESIVDVLRAFYQVIKDRNGEIQFAFITGVTKFSHTNMFSGFNSPTDLTRMPQYAEMLGYTETELTENFSEYINLLANKEKLSCEDTVKKIKKWYNGFLFEESARHVINPVSAGKLFANMDFRNYWADTGTPKFIVDIAKCAPFFIEDKRNKFVVDAAFDKYDVKQLDPFVFAVQCGYLTLQETKKRFGETVYRFDYPNMEVRQTFVRFLFNSSISKSSSDAVMLFDELANAMADNNLELFLEKLKYAFAGIPWGNIGNTDNRPEQFYEGYFRNIMTFLMILMSADYETETRTADGQIDLTCRINGIRYIFELKIGKAQDREKLLDKAIAQVIEEKKYHERFLNSKDRIIVAGLAFDEEKHTMLGSKIRQIR